MGAVATFVVLWNNIATGFVDFDNVAHGPLLQHLPKLNIPPTVFTLTSPSLGLLLVFRTNACYGRWDNSRKVSPNPNPNPNPNPSPTPTPTPTPNPNPSPTPTPTPTPTPDP